MAEENKDTQQNQENKPEEPKKKEESKIGMFLKKKALPTGVKVGKFLLKVCVGVGTGFAVTSAISNVFGKEYYVVQKPIPKVPDRSNVTETIENPTPAETYYGEVQDL